MNRIIGLLVMGLCLSLSNCGNNAQLEQGSIEQTAWQLVEMPTKMPKETSFKIAFEAGTLVGKGPCNRYHATYYASEGTFSISGGIGRTQEECPASGPLEKDYYNYLHSSTIFGYQGEQLVMRSSYGDLVFESIPFTTELN